MRQLFHSLHSISRRGLASRGHGSACEPRTLNLAASQNIAGSSVLQWNHQYALSLLLSDLLELVSVRTEWRRTWRRYAVESTRDLAFIAGTMEKVRCESSDHTASTISVDYLRCAASITCPSLPGRDASTVGAISMNSPGHSACLGTSIWAQASSRRIHNDPADSSWVRCRDRWKINDWVFQATMVFSE